MPASSTDRQHAVPASSTGRLCGFTGQCRCRLCVVRNAFDGELQKVSTAVTRVYETAMGMDFGEAMTAPWAYVETQPLRTNKEDPSLAGTVEAMSRTENQAKASKEGGAGGGKAAIEKRTTNAAFKCCVCWKTFPSSQKKAAEAHHESLFFGKEEFLKCFPTCAEKARKEERIAAQNYEMLKQPLTDEVKFANSDMDKAMKNLAESHLGKATATGGLEVTSTDHKSRGVGRGDGMGSPMLPNSRSGNQGGRPSANQGSDEQVGRFRAWLASKTFLRQGYQKGALLNSLSKEEACRKGREMGLSSFQITTERRLARLATQQDATDNEVGDGGEESMDRYAQKLRTDLQAATARAEMAEAGYAELAEELAEWKTRARKAEALAEADQEAIEDLWASRKRARLSSEAEPLPAAATARRSPSPMSAALRLKRKAASSRD